MRTLDAPHNDAVIYVLLGLAAVLALAFAVLVWLARDTIEMMEAWADD